MEKNNRLFIKVHRNNLPQIKDKYPFLYLERGRLEIDDSSVKWIDCDGSVVRLPVATISTLLLGPGTSVTHEAIKIMATVNCTVCWVGEDSMLFYAVGTTPTSDTRNMRTQMESAVDKKKRVEVARRMFAYRFSNVDVQEKTIAELMGMEGKRIKILYESKAKEYNVGWRGRCYVPGKFEMGDLPNQILTSANAALYGILTSSILAMGFSPHIGFVHSGSPLPFVYDLADLYKEYLTIDLAFSLTLELGGQYNKYRVAEEFKNRVIEVKLLENVSKDIKIVLGIN